MALRIIFGIGLFASALMMPLWFTALAGLVGLFLFASYYELVGIAFLIDLLYGVPETRFAGFQLITTVVALIVVIFADIMRKRMLR